MNDKNRCIMYWHFGQIARELGFRAAVLKAKELGFRGIELLETAEDAPLFSSAEEARRAGEILAEEGMIAACYSVGITLYQSEEAVELLKKHADLAAALGSPYLHHTLYLDLNADTAALPFDAVFSDILPRAIQVARYCEQLNISCLYEAQGMYFNGIENFGRFFREIQKSCSNVGICGDMGNPLFAGTAPADFFRTFAGDIRHVHVKDYLHQSAVPGGCSSYYTLKDGSCLISTATGSGVSDVTACMEALRTVGYSGHFGFEQELAYPEPYCTDAAATMRLLERF